MPVNLDVVILSAALRRRFKVGHSRRTKSPVFMGFAAAVDLRPPSVQDALPLQSLARCGADGGGRAGVAGEWSQAPGTRLGCR